jgi:hypothetical protein
MGERFHRLGALCLVALEAHLRLRRRLQHRVARDVHLVAIHAGDLVDRVLAGVPAETDTAVVTLEALAVLFLDGGRTAEVKEGYRRAFLSAPHAAGVIAAGPVAGLALQLAVAERAPRVRRHSVLGTEDREYRLVFVTRQAGIRAFAAVVGPLLAVSGADGQAGQQGSCDN